MATQESSASADAGDRFATIAVVSIGPVQTPELDDKHNGRQPS